MIQGIRNYFIRKKEREKIIHYLLQEGFVEYSPGGDSRNLPRCWQYFAFIRFPLESQQVFLNFPDCRWGVFTYGPNIEFHTLEQLRELRGDVEDKYIDLFM